MQFEGTLVAKATLNENINHVIRGATRRNWKGGPEESQFSIARFVCTYSRTVGRVMTQIQPRPCSITSWFFVVGVVRVRVAPLVPPNRPVPIAKRRRCDRHEFATFRDRERARVEEAKGVVMRADMQAHVLDRHNVASSIWLHLHRS